MAGQGLTMRKMSCKTLKRKEGRKEERRDRGEKGKDGETNAKVKEKRM